MRSFSKLIITMFIAAVTAAGVFFMPAAAQSPLLTESSPLNAAPRQSSKISTARDQAGTFPAVSITLRVGGSQDLKKLLAFSYNEKGTFDWSTDNHLFASVNSSGKAIAKKAGAATISAVYTAPDGVTSQQKFKVRIISLSGTRKTFETGPIYVQAGSTKNLKKLLNFTHSKDGTFQWSSDKKGVATVDSNGRITAKKAGAVTITAKYTTSTYTTYTQVFTVNVTPGGGTAIK